MEFFFLRLETYTKVPLAAGMTDIIIKVMLEVLTVLAIATKVMKHGRMSESVLRGSPNLNSVLSRKILEEVDRKRRDREGLTKAGPINSRRGDDGLNRAAQNYTRC